MIKEERNEILKTEEFKDYISDLSIFAESYVETIRKDLIQNAFENFKDKTIVKLLGEHAARKKEERQTLFNDIMYALQYDDDDVEPQLSNNCLTNATHYKTVLADLLIKRNG